jgi:lysophospholipase L1-like esterase
MAFTRTRVASTAAAFAAGVALTVGVASQVFASAHVPPHLTRVAAVPTDSAPPSAATATPAIKILRAATAQTAPSARALRIMPIGDSITRGPIETPHSYRVELAARLAAAGMAADFVGSQHSGTGPDVDHEGHSHWTIGMITEKIDGWLAAYEPDVILLHIGTNDMPDQVHADAAPALLTTLLQHIAVDRPTAQVFVAQIIASKTVDRNLRTDIYNTQVAGIVAAAGSQFHLVDQRDVGGLDTGPGALDLRDNLHPNTFGYAKMAFNWYHALQAVYATPSAPWPAGANPFTATKAYVCRALNAAVFTSPADCRWWYERHIAQTVDGESVQANVWQTVRAVNQRYRAWVVGYYAYPVKSILVDSRRVSRKVKTWVPAHAATRIRRVNAWVGV